MNKTKIGVVGILVVLLILRVALVPNPGAEEAAPAAPLAFLAEKSKADQQAKIQALQRRVTEQETDAIQRHAARTEAVLDRVFPGQNYQIESAIDELTNVNGTIRLVALSVEDQIFGTTKTAAYVSSVVAPCFAVPIGVSMQGINASLADLEKDLNGITYEYCSSVREIERVEGFIPNGLLSTIRTPQIPAVHLCEAAIKTSLSTAFLAVDAMFVPALMVSIRSVLQCVITRAAGTVLASGTLVVVDGPIPFGDAIAAIVGVGGSIWSAYDLYHARKVLIPEVRHKLHHEYALTQNSIRKAAEAQTLKLVEAHQKARTTFATNLLKL
jgi:hypothetical protein